MAKPDFRAAAAVRLNEERGQELSSSVLNLLHADDTAVVRPSAVRNIAVDRIVPNPNQPRLSVDEAGMEDLTASVKEHGVLQPVLVRTENAGRYQLVAGERRWRAAMAAGLESIPALIEDIDDETALEISIIENLQREDLSPLDEATIYDRMIRQFGYSIRKLAQKLGKDKGYIENRLRLADAPQEVRDLVSARKDTLSHAYELMKVTDAHKRKKLAEQVARGELSLVKLRAKIEEGPRKKRDKSDSVSAALGTIEDAIEAEAEANWMGSGSKRALTDDSLIAVRNQLNSAISEMIAVLGSDVMHNIDDTDRQNLIKYLMIARVRLENAIGLVRRGTA